MCKKPAIWFPTVRTNTGTDVFTERLVSGLHGCGIRAEITWLPPRAEYAPWTVAAPKPPEWATVAHVNSWLPRRFWPKDLPVVTTVHHLVHDPAYRPFRSLAQATYHNLLIRHRERIACREAAAVTTISAYVHRTVEEFSGRRPINIIDNWVDCEKFCPAPNPLHENNRTFRLFMAGSCSRRKGFDLLPAFSMALGSDFVIRYAGGAPNTLPPLAGVIELGRISEQQLIIEYQTCDAVVSLSRYEGFGYTAAEAMACGKPFLGFNTSGLADVVAPDCGTLVMVDDVVALAAAARQLRMQPILRRDKGMAGRQRMLAKFTPNNINAYIEIYKQQITAKNH